jgi:hypothetical protein
VRENVKAPDGLAERSAAEELGPVGRQRSRNSVIVKMVIERGPWAELVQTQVTVNEWERNGAEYRIDPQTGCEVGAMELLDDGDENLWWEWRENVPQRIRRAWRNRHGGEIVRDKEKGLKCGASAARKWMKTPIAVPERHIHNKVLDEMVTDSRCHS